MKGLQVGSIILLLSFLVAAVSSAAITTQETLVATKSEDEVTPAATAEPDITTEEPAAPIKLTEMRVHSEIALRYARTAVVSTVRNPAKRSQEAVFRMLLPETAFISGFVMTLDGKSYKAYVKEKEEAKNIYNQAVSQGVGAAHISAKARDSNHFTVSVNVEPNTTAVFNLTYEELLVRRNGVYNHAINLHPGALVPKLKVTVHIRENEKITTLRVPEIKTGNEIDATDADAQNPIAKVDRGHDDREATISFKPDLQEQKRLIDVYAAKSKESASHRPHYYGDFNQDDKEEGTIGQFVVQYDVDRTNNKEVLVNDGYFVHFLAPNSLPPLKKHVVFVLDTSGSMMGRKIDQLREAMKTILAKLNPGDYFSIVEFNSDVVVHNLNEANAPHTETRRPWEYNYRRQNTVLVPPSLSTPENIEKAQIIISRLQSYGGTNIYSALSVAIDLIRKGINWVETSNNTENLTESSTTEAVTAPSDITKESDLEPIIIFLTDGDPTEGETNTARIIAHLSEKNYGDKKASIFSLAFGEDADRNFLRKISLRNEGFMRHIYEAADAALQLQDFYQQVSSPLLSDVKFVYPKNQVKEGSVTRSKFRAVYAGSEVVVAGRVQDDVPEIQPEVTGFCGVDDGAGKKKYSISPKIPVSSIKNEYMPLERLWAYLTIKQLLDEKDAADSEDKSENSPEKKALDIALKYEFVTPLTSLVVVKPNATDAVNAESVDKNPSDYPGIGGIPLSSMSGSFSGNQLNAQSFSFGLPGAPARPMFSQSSGFGGGFGGGVSAQSGPSISDSMLSLSHEAEEVDALYDLAEDEITPAFRTSFHRPLVLKSAYQPMNRFADIRVSEMLTFDAVSTTIPPPPPPSSPLKLYHLEEFKWAKELLSESDNKLKFNINGTQVELNLTKDETITNYTEEECKKATSGGNGLCVYITQCPAAKTITVHQYQELYCIVGNGYAGVCCPSNEVTRI